MDSPAETTAPTVDTNAESVNGSTSNTSNSNSSDRNRILATENGTAPPVVHAPPNAMPDPATPGAPFHTQASWDEEAGMRLRKNAGVASNAAATKDAAGAPMKRSHHTANDGPNSSFSAQKQGGLVDHQRQDQPIAIKYTATKTPKSTLNAVYEVGKYKAGLPLDLLCIQSIMAGIYIGMAGHLYLALGGGVLGSVFFPTGLIAVTLTSAELYTGDALVFVASVLGKKVTVAKLLRNWTVSWTMNFVGGLFWAYVLAYGSDALDDAGARELAIKIAIKKADQPFYQIFLKGIGANFMVCLGVWQATCAEQVAGKILALWFPISGFVIMGFDHSIANQFFIPLGMMLGTGDEHEISFGDLFYALAAATIGNAVGGGLMVGAVYWYVYDSMARNTRVLGQLRRRFNNTNQDDVPPPPPPGSDDPMTSDRFITLQVSADGRSIRSMGIADGNQYPTAADNDDNDMHGHNEFIPVQMKSTSIHRGRLENDGGLRLS